MSEILQCFAGCYFQVSTLICNKKLRTVYIRMNFIVIIAVVQPGTMGIQTPHYFDLPCELTLWGSKHPKDSYPTTLVYLVIGLWTDTVGVQTPQRFTPHYFGLPCNWLVNWHCGVQTPQRLTPHYFGPPCNWLVNSTTGVFRSWN